MNNPKKCSFAGWISEKLDGRLSEADTARFDGHLRDCADCREQLLGWSEIRRGFFSPRAVEDPGWGFDREVIARIERHALSRESRWAGVFRWPVPALGLVASLAFMWFLALSGSDQAVASDWPWPDPDAVVENAEWMWGAL